MGLGILSYSHFLHAGGDFPAVVTTEPAVEIQMAPSSWSAGTIVGRYDSNISAEVDGRLTSVVEVGDQLKEGQELAVVDPTRYRLSVNEISAELKPLEAELGFYERESGRLKMLEKNNNAAKNRLDEIQMNRDQTLGKIQVIKARLARARDELSKSSIKAPFDGVVVECFKTDGERVDAGDAVIRLVNTSQLEVQARVPASQVFKFQADDLIRVKDGENEVAAQVRAIVPVGDDRSRLYELRLIYSGQDWPIGHAVKVAVPTDKPRMVVAVPRDALVIRNNGIRVFRVNSEGVSEAVNVNTGLANDTHIEIIGDIRVGDAVITRGNERLRPGQKLVIQPGSNNS